jgi:glycosyltransferase involved in cell wall biosynthesis
MRVTLVTETYPPEVNGVALTLERLVAGLAEHGHDIEVVRPRQPADAPSSGGSSSDTRASCVGAERVSARPPGNPSPVTGLTPSGIVPEVLVGGLPIPVYRGLRFGYYNRRLLLRRWRKARPDVVHVATEGPLGLSAIFAARGVDLPISTSFHTNFHTYGRYYGFGLLTRRALAYLRWVHNRADCTLVPSPDTLATLQRQGFRNLAILGRGVDLERFDPARRSEALRRSWGARDDDLVVLYVGRLAPEKNVDLAIASYRALQRRVPRARMVLVGDGPARAVLERDNPDLHFAGQRIGIDLASHYASGDLLAFPSLTETFGNVLTEGLASGLAVVAFDYAAAALHVEHLRTGVLVPRGDAAGFRDEVARLGLRPATIQRLREAARQRATSLSWPAVVSDFEDRLTHVAGGRGWDCSRRAGY